MHDLEALPRPQLEAMQAAGEAVLDCYRDLAARDAHLAGELLAGHDTFEEEVHYPDGEVRDPVSHAQYYYHAHLDDEHGHFHTFLRLRGIPHGLRPLAKGPPMDRLMGDEPMAHLVGVSLDPHGLPVRLFTTNHWVTQGNWYAADDVGAMLDRFDLAHAAPALTANRWLPALLTLFRPQIERLLRARDETLARWQEENPGRNALLAEELVILSKLSISLDAHLAAVSRALATPS